jgi:FkbM family methyltransferase
MNYYSQFNQDKFLNEVIFKEIQQGFFVDIGAHEGIDLSNSYFFEKHMQWDGICIEPIPDVYANLIKNRNCKCIEGAIDNKNGFQDFWNITGQIQMFSGLLDRYDPRHIELITNTLPNIGGSKEIIRVKTFTLESVFDKMHVTNVDLLSVDTEGAELSVLESIDYTKVKIECIVTENNYSDSNVEQFLNSKGFRLVQKLHVDDVYLHCDSKFSLD